MAVMQVQCPACHSADVVQYGKQANGTQRSRCDNRACPRTIFHIRPPANIHAKFQIETWKVQEPGDAFSFLPLDFRTSFSAEFQEVARLLSASKWWCNKCTFRTRGRREHLLYGCGAQQGVCRKTPDIKPLAVPSGKLHGSLPTA